MRWAVETRAGYAWAGSTYRQAGVAVDSAAEDVERLRKIFVAHIAKPRRTVLHGQSWGGGVAAVAAQTYALLATRIQPSMASCSRRASLRAAPIPTISAWTFA